MQIATASEEISESSIKRVKTFNKDFFSGTMYTETEEFKSMYLKSIKRKHFNLLTSIVTILNYCFK